MNPSQPIEDPGPSPQERFDAVLAGLDNIPAEEVRQQIDRVMAYCRPTKLQRQRAEAKLAKLGIELPAGDVGELAVAMMLLRNKWKRDLKAECRT